MWSPDSHCYSEWLRCLSSWVYNGTTPKTCAGCHTTDYNATTNLIIRQPRLLTACESLRHSQNAWAPATFDHNKTKFPLTRSTYHRSMYTVSYQRLYRNIDRLRGCHLAKFNATTKPNHKTLALSTACATCRHNGARLGTSLIPESQVPIMWSPELTLL